MDIKKINTIEEFQSLSIDSKGNNLFPIAKYWMGEYEWGTYNSPHLTKQEAEPEPKDPESIMEVLKIFSLEHLESTISEELEANEMWDLNCYEDPDWYGGYTKEYCKTLNVEKFFKFLKERS